MFLQNPSSVSTRLAFQGLQPFVVSDSPRVVFDMQQPMRTESLMRLPGVRKSSEPIRE